MNIKVLGTGCAKCIQTTNLIGEVLAETGANAEVEKVEDIQEIVKYNVMTTPAVIVDGEMKVKGRVPSKEEIKEWVGA